MEPLSLAPPNGKVVPTEKEVINKQTVTDLLQKWVKDLQTHDTDPNIFGSKYDVMIKSWIPFWLKVGEFMAMSEQKDVTALCNHYSKEQGPLFVWRIGDEFLKIGVATVSSPGNCVTMETKGFLKEHVDQIWSALKAHPTDCNRFRKTPTMLPF